MFQIKFESSEYNISTYITIIMRVVARRTSSLLMNMQYRYTPVSNFEIQKKVNPIIAVTLGYQKHVFDFHFRVYIVSFSSLKMLYPELLRISKDFYLELHSLTEDHFHLLTIKSTISFPEDISNLDISKEETVLSLDLNLEMNLSSYLMIDLDC